MLEPQSNALPLGHARQQYILYLLFEPRQVIFVSLSKKVNKNNDLEQVGIEPTSITSNKKSTLPKKCL